MIRIIVIHQSNDIRNAFLSNETKVKEGVACYFHCANTLSVNPFLYDQRHQPYFVYKHQDLDRVHFHVVSTRIDRTTGKKVRDGYEKDKMQKFVKELEQKYQLKQEMSKEFMNLKFTASSGNLKQNMANQGKIQNRRKGYN